MKIDKIINRAKEIAIEQGCLANSPAEVSKDGETYLCAASCIAKAAIDIDQGRESSENFNRSVLIEKKETFVPSIFEKYGLGQELAKRIMIQNDDLYETSRLSWFLKLSIN